MEGIAPSPRASGRTKARTQKQLWDTELLGSKWSCAFLSTCAQWNGEASMEYGCIPMSPLSQWLLGGPWKLKFWNVCQALETQRSLIPPCWFQVPYQCLYGWLHSLSPPHQSHPRHSSGSGSAAYCLASCGPITVSGQALPPGSSWKYVMHICVWLMQRHTLSQ